jgi:hypothetical protein
MSLYRWKKPTRTKKTPSQLSRRKSSAMVAVATMISHPKRSRATNSLDRLHSSPILSQESSGRTGAKGAKGRGRRYSWYVRGEDPLRLAPRGHRSPLTLQALNRGTLQYVQMPLLERSEEARAAFVKAHGMLVVLEALRIAFQREHVAVLLRVANLVSTLQVFSSVNWY